MPSRTHNPEKRAWRGKSYRKGGERVRDLRDASAPEVPMATNKIGHVEVEELEEDVMDVTRRLKEGVEGDSSVTRDMMGTLWVNLSAMRRETEKTIEALEKKYGFR